MANLKEDNTWEQGIYQFETSDPVMGGPNGIDNVPTRQLANRTLWLKNQLAAAVQSINTNQTNANNTYATKATTLTAGIGLTGGGTLGGNRVLSMGKPSKITATSTDEAVSDTHSHSIDKASTSVAGIVMLVNALNSTATDCALTAAQGKALADALQNKSDKGHTHRAAEITDFAEAAAALTVHQKIGTFDICKLPDGTQIESGTVRIQNHNNNSTAQRLTWPLAFVTDPVVVATMSAPEGNVRDMWVTIDSGRSDRSAVHYWLFEPAYNTPDVTVNFVAIGRWK